MVGTAGDPPPAGAPTRPLDGAVRTPPADDAVPSPVLIAAEQSAANGQALRVMGALAVRGRAPRAGYDRTLFGQRWADTDRNGCDTRNDVLRRDLTQVVLDPGTRGCAVASGSLHDPYLGETVPYRRRADSDVNVDHVVALADAWQKGAATWSAERRERFANDPGNLLAVSGRANLQKRDSDAASWLPPHKSSRCGYVSLQVQVKARYGLWVTAAERAAVARVLTSCAQASGTDAPQPQPRPDQGS